MSLSFETFLGACPMIRPMPASSADSFDISQEIEVMSRELWLQSFGLQDPTKGIARTCEALVLGTALHIAEVRERVRAIRRFKKETLS